jgi:hypothetical protein
MFQIVEISASAGCLVLPAHVANRRRKPDAAEKPDAKQVPDAYDVLYDFVMTRQAANGKTYGRNEIEPLIYEDSEFPFDPKSLLKLASALDAVAAVSDEQVSEYSVVQRTLLQRHLWKVFDATQPSPRFAHNPSHLSNRIQLRPRLATVMQKIALKKSEILALPDNRTATLNAENFPTQFDPIAPQKPFFPDFHGKDSSWACFGKVGVAVPAVHHDNSAKSRSAFFAFMSVPGSREQTLAAIEKLETVAFPTGTQFALVEQAFLISDEFELVLSPLVMNLQLRTHMVVDFDIKDSSRPLTTSYGEFTLRPRQLIKGNAIMRAIGAEERRIDSFVAVQDPVERAVYHAEDVRLRSCIACHGGPGLRSIGSRNARHPKPFEERSPTKINQATTAAKRNHATWKLLQRHWSSEGH